MPKYYIALVLNWLKSNQNSEGNETEIHGTGRVVDAELAMITRVPLDFRSNVRPHILLRRLRGYVWLGLSESPALGVDSSCRKWQT